MLSLNDREWKEFLVKDILDSFNSKAYHSENLLFPENATTAYITRTASDNGLFGLTDTTDGTYEMNPANTISFGAETAEFFYQTFPYITGNKMYYLKSDLMSMYSGLFFVTELRKGIKNCFSYANGAILSRVVRKKIMLPISTDEKPDYDFMEAYVKEQGQVKIDNYIRYCKQKLSELGTPNEICEISQKEWHEFFINNIFDEVERGKRLKKDDHIKGDKPYVSSTSLNNGVDQFIGNSKGVRFFSNCLSLANSGSVGSCFYEPFQFVASDHITHLKKYDSSKYIYLFMATMLKRLSGKYNFNREINDFRINREKILLPVNETGKPDYAYMEQYAKNMMIRKYQQYLDYYEKSKN